MARTSALLTLVSFVTLVAAPLSAAPDAKLRDQMRASIDRGLNWTRWQLRTDGGYGNVAATAEVVRVFAQSHRKYVEDDGPFMRQPIAFLKQKFSPAVPLDIAASISAVAAVGNRQHQSFLDQQTKALTKWIDSTVSSQAAVELHTTAFVVAALRASSAVDLSVWLRVRQLVERSQPPRASGTAALLDDATRLYCLVASGVSPEVDRVKEALAAVRRAYPSRSNTPLPLAHAYALVRALDVLREPTVADARGMEHDWRTELAERIIAAQQFDGFWIERDERIAPTTAAISALELIYNGQ